MVPPPYSVELPVLRDFVFESNAIEGYPPAEYPEDSSLFRQHLYAAERVVETGEWDPLRIHFMLLNGTSMLPPNEIGIYRNIQVWVGGHTPPEPGAHLLGHMRKWTEEVVKGPASEDPDVVWTWTWNVHHHFESIHPFTDGNGRTGRLILNSLRLRYGLPWETVRVGAQQKHYYLQIQTFQNSQLWECSKNPWYTQRDQS